MGPDLLPVVDNAYMLMTLRFYASWPWVGLLLLVMACDFGTGIMAAIYEKQLSSKIGYRGVMKKAAELMVVAMGVLLEQAIKNTLPEAVRPTAIIPIAKLVAGFFLINECLSILENARRCGVPLPSFLTKSLADTLSRYNLLDRNPKNGTTDVVDIKLKEGGIEATVHRGNEPPRPTPPPPIDTNTL